MHHQIVRRPASAPSDVWSIFYPYYQIIQLPPRFVYLGNQCLIMENHIFNERRKRFEPKDRKCAFCKTGTNNGQMEDNCFFSVYNEKGRTNLVVFRNVKFNEVKIGVPRCEACSKTHSLVKGTSCLAIIVAVLSVFVVPIYLSVTFDLGTVPMIILMAITFGLAVLAVMGLEKFILNLKDVKSEKDGALTNDLVRAFVRNGWSVDRPNA